MNLNQKQSGYMEFKSFFLGVLSTALVLTLMSSTSSNNNVSFEHVGAVSHAGSVYAVVAIDGGADYRMVKVQ